MNTGLEYNLALRVRSATRWVEGQQGMLSDEGDGAVDGFGRAMLVRTGALPTPYTGAEGVAGTTIDQQPTGANVAGVAVLIKDLNGGKLAANTTYSARLGGFLTGKALYFVEAAASSGGLIAVGSMVTGRFSYGMIDIGNGVAYPIDGFNTTGNDWRAYVPGLMITGVMGANTRVSYFSHLEFSLRVRVQDDGTRYGLPMLKSNDYNLPIRIQDPISLSKHPYTTWLGYGNFADIHLPALSNVVDGVAHIATLKMLFCPAGPIWTVVGTPSLSSTLGAPLGAPLGG